MIINFVSLQVVRNVSTKRKSQILPFVTGTKKFKLEQIPLGSTWQPAQSFGLPTKK